MLHTINKRINSKNGQPKLWLEGRRLTQVGFLPGTKYEIFFLPEDKSLRIQADPQGKRVVSSHRDQPVLDIESKQFAGMYDLNAELQIQLTQGQITVKLHPQTLQQQMRIRQITERLQAGLPLRTAAMYFGAGLLDHALHSALQSAQLPAELTFMVERETRYVDHACTHNPLITQATHTIEADTFDLFHLDLPQVDILTAGIPCTAISKAGRAKHQTALPEQHPAGTCFQDVVLVVRKTNPALVVLENVPGYLNTAGYATLKQSLQRLGYTITEQVLNGLEHGALEDRSRLVVIASSLGMVQVMPESARGETALADVLTEVPMDSTRWKDHTQLSKKAISDRAAGKGFRMQLLQPQASHCGTIGRGYAKQRSTEPRIVHPHDPQKSRLLTPMEHARVKGVPYALVEAESETLQHQLLGQGVVYGMFVAVGRALARKMQSLQTAGGDLNFLGIKEKSSNKGKQGILFS
ncbi:DNA cytosine methyltransferase [Deinococcus roseus]|uniref:DNA (cytosine-5-)-methyltransferase n=1 Tax=Deinococcus roseus TaxID=392414 RepID=A0ABQ2D616_9DEIO|nr:DNA cytosine methyltransferase [Deinococcus roseus]GGJ44507.1 DNA methyltransferase [Deinococcus roseus]